MVWCVVCDVWCGVVIQMAMRRALMRMVHARLAAALSTWRVAAAQMKGERDAIKRAVMRMLNKNGWLTYFSSEEALALRH